MDISPLTLTILEDVYSCIRGVEEWWKGPIAEEPIDDLAIGSLVEELRSNLIRAPYRWFQVSPIEYDLKLIQRDDSYYYSASPKVGYSALAPQQFPLPSEIGRWIWRLVEYDSSDELSPDPGWYDLVDEAMAALSQLQSDITLHQEIAEAKARDANNVAAPASELIEHAPFYHSDDYGSCRLRMGDGSYQTFTFTLRQARIIEILDVARLRRMPDVSKELVMSKLDEPNSDFWDAFRSAPEVRGVLIVPGTRRGTVRLNIPCDSA